MKTTAFLIIALQVCHSLGDDGSARCYTSLETDRVVCKYALLSRKQVQEALQLSSKQVADIKGSVEEDMGHVPGIIELRQTRQQRLEAANSDEERTRIRAAGNERINSLVHHYWAATLQRTLSSNQLHRLDQLLLQMRGPVIILEDTNLSHRLNFSNEQLEHLAQIDNSYSPSLGLLRHRFVGLEVNPVRKRSASDVNAEMEGLTRVIKEMERDRDFEFFGVWDKPQRTLWGELAGEPLNIEWGPESFSDVPFKE